METPLLIEVPTLIGIAERMAGTAESDAGPGSPLVACRGLTAGLRRTAVVEERPRARD